MSKKIVVSGVGCCLVDVLYNDIRFSGEPIRPFLSKARGDGGLSPGHLVFQEEFEKYAGQPFSEVLNKITQGKVADKLNIGGPSIVSLINAAQLTSREQCEIRFFGRSGNDENGRYLLLELRKMPLILWDYKLTDNRTPSTVVLSDPTFDNGNGERMFLNSIGAAWDYLPEHLDDSFFDSDLVVFGGTALVPNIHDHLTDLLKKAKTKNCQTLVNTVFDFRSEKSNPHKRWPLGESEESYKYIDLLIADQEEAFRLSGTHKTGDALRFFREKQVSSVIITNGVKNIVACSDGHFLQREELLTLPVSSEISDKLRDYRGGDTTGCGDNFAGGVIASVVSQLHSGISHPDIREACCWGIVSGGFTCFYMGGTYFENESGEKKTQMQAYYESYRNQIR